MKIFLRALCQKDTAEIIAKEFSQTLDPDAIIHMFDSDSDLFNIFLEATKTLTGCWFNPIVEFEKKEIDQVSLFQIEYRGKALKMTKKDEAINLQIMKKTKFIYTGKKIKINLMPQIALTKIDLKPNMIGAAGEWLDEYVLPKMLVKAFQEAGLSGFETRSILNTRSNEYFEEYFQLYSENIMPIAEMDITTIKNRIEGVEEEAYSFRRLGCLIYQFKGNEKICDFNRTAENWSSNYFPTWVVTSKTKDCYERNNLKGWYFHPILEKETDLYQVYISKWEDLFKRVRINHRNRIN